MILGWVGGGGGLIEGGGGNRKHSSTINKYRFLERVTHVGSMADVLLCCRATARGMLARRRTKACFLKRG